MKKAQQRLINLRRLKKFGLSSKIPQTFRCTIESILSGLITRLVRQLHHPQPQGSPEGGAVCTTHHRGQTTCPPGHLQHLMSQEGQKDHQGQQPPKPLPVHPATIQKEMSVQVHQAGKERLKNSFYLKVIRLLNSHYTNTEAAAFIQT